jgi:hypothetical protein
MERDRNRAIPQIAGLSDEMALAQKAALSGLSTTLADSPRQHHAAAADFTMVGGCS